VRQPSVDRLAAEHGADCTVLRHGSAALVAYVEARLRGEPADPAIPADALAGLLDQPGGDRMDMVVLACTHFPLVKDELAAAAPRPITFLDGGAGIARRIAYLNGDQPWPETAPAGQAIFTRRDAGIDALVPALARYGLTQVNVL
jgi:glutamate racemase